MASRNPFDLLDDDTEDPSLIIAAAAAAANVKKSSAPAAASNKPAKLPSKPLPPTHRAARDARNEAIRGGVRWQARVDKGETVSLAENGMSFEVLWKESSERRGPVNNRSGYHGGRRDGFRGFSDEEVEECPRRIYDRRSGTGRGTEFKRDGAGRGNWGSTAEITQETVVEIVAQNKAADTAEKLFGGEDYPEADKEFPVDKPPEKEPDEKQMTLTDYEKLLKEKRKALLSLIGKEMEAGEEVSDTTQRQGSDTDERKETAEREDRVRKLLNITYTTYRDGGRGRGNNCGRGGYGGGYPMNHVAATTIELDDGNQFPMLGGQ